MKSHGSKLECYEADGNPLSQADPVTSQHSFEFPTQNELTQLCDFDEVESDEDDEDDGGEEVEGGDSDVIGTQNSNKSRKKKKRRKRNPASPLINLKNIPWGRLVPATVNMTTNNPIHTAVDLFPRDPTTRGYSTNTGVFFLGLHHLDSSDRFNEHVIGRSNKCDVLAQKRLQSQDTAETYSSASSQDWVHAMISNRHCRIFSMLSKTCGQAQPTEVL